MTTLQKTLGLGSLTFYGIGLILGAGIYTILGRAAAVSGDALWMSFAAGGVVALLTALSYAELSTMFPSAGAEYVFVRRAWPDAWWLAAAVGFAFLVSGTATCATVAVAFAGYASSFVDVPPWLVAAGLVAAVAALNVVGVRESSRVNVVFTLIEVAGLVALVAVGIGQPDFGKALTAAPHAGVLAGASLVFFAFLGFEDIANLAEEAKDARRDVPRAILLALFASVVLYVLVALACVALVDPASLGSSDSPLADAMQAGAPRWTGALAGIALFATANTALIAMLAASRMLFGMARGGDAPRVFERLLPGRKTPGWATLAVAAGAGLLLPLGRVEVLGSLASLTALLAFATVNLCVIALRVKKPKAERPFRIPFSIRNLPVSALAGVLLSLVLVVRFELLAYALFAATVVLGVAMVWGSRRRGADGSVR
jgi:APA family basic amino acid/polyamine antiporter